MADTTDNARQMGALACSCDLDRDANPFPHGSEERLAWIDGFEAEMRSWRAERRAEIADEYGDEAADYF